MSMDRNDAPLKDSTSGMLKMATFQPKLSRTPPTMPTALIGQQDAAQDTPSRSRPGCARPPQAPGRCPELPPAAGKP